MSSQATVDQPLAVGSVRDDEPFEPEDMVNIGVRWSAAAERLVPLLPAIDNAQVRMLGTALHLLGQNMQIHSARAVGAVSRGWVREIDAAVALLERNEGQPRELAAPNGHFADAEQWLVWLYGRVRALDHEVREPGPFGRRVPFLPMYPE